MRLDEGLVFLSDTRTNAGLDNISTYRKLHLFRPAADRLLVLQSAGNLATTQEVQSPVLAELRDLWERNILNAVGQLPDVELSDVRAAEGLGA
jgi:putative proteasome-type protease